MKKNYYLKKNVSRRYSPKKLSKKSNKKKVSFLKTFRYSELNMYICICIFFFEFKRWFGGLKCTLCEAHEDCVMSKEGELLIKLD